MRKLIEQLEKLAASENKSMRDYAKELKTTHTTLSRYKKPDRTFGDFFQLLERIRKKLKMSKSKFWDKLTEK